MLSSSLGNLLQTMEQVKNIEGVAERDATIIESKQAREGIFLDQVMGLAGIEEGHKAGTKYSDGQITLNVDSEDYAKSIMDLAQAKGIAKGEIVPQRLKDGSVQLSIMPHVFVSSKMEDVRHMVSLGLVDEDYKNYNKMVKSLGEANPNHGTDGEFMSQDAMKDAPLKGGSRSFQFSAPNDDGTHKRDISFSRKTKKGDIQTFNSPQYKHKNNSKGGFFRIRKKKPCGRMARNNFRAKLGLDPLPANKLYIRCFDGKKGTWAEGVQEMGAYDATKQYLASVLRSNKG